MSEKPTIVETNIIAESKLFKIESVSLAFSNGESRVYERFHSSRRGAVLMVPWHSDSELILIREYSVGTDSYTLGFPKGLIDPGESELEACNRELQEEIGYKAEKLERIKSIATAPGFSSAFIHVYSAQGLIPSSLEGDEPEPIETEIIHLDDIPELLQRDDFIEARSLAALLLVLYQRRSL